MKTLLTVCCALLMSTTSSATTMLFDFGNTGRQTAGWNNVVPATTDLFAIFDDGGEIVPNVTFSITDTFFQTSEPSQLGSESPMGDAAGFPVDATDDYFFGHTGPFAGGDDNPYGEVKLSGLDPTKTYDFTFFSARNGVNDDRATEFAVNGSNSGSGVAATSNNNTEVLRINGITPDGNNEIFVGVQAAATNTNGNGFYYINLMQVTEVVPEPSSALLLLVGGLLVAGRRARQG